MFIIEFFRIRDADGAHATLDRVAHDTTDLEDAKVRARSLFETLVMPQRPMPCGSWIKTEMRCFSGVRSARAPECGTATPRLLLALIDPWENSYG